MDNNSEVVYLYLDDIIPNRFQPREVFNEQALKELAVSIKEHGVIQPIIVRQVGNKYEIIAGERRYKASTMAGLNKIPAIIKNYDDKESSKVALIENLQRRDLTPIEEARTYQKILELEDNMTQEELAATMGKTQASVSNKLRLLALPDEVQDALLNEKISERHARSLLNIDNANDQVKMLNRIISERLTVRELDKKIKEMNEVHTEDDKEPISTEIIDDDSSYGKPLFAPTSSFVAPSIPKPVVEEKKDNVIEEKTEDKVIEDAKEADAAIVTEPTTNPTADNIEETNNNVASEVTEEDKAQPVEEEKKKQTFNFDFSTLSNPFLKKKESISSLADNNIPSVIDGNSVKVENTKNYASVKTDVSSFVSSLKNKGYNCVFKEIDGDNKIEYVITVEK